MLKTCCWHKDGFLEYFEGDPYGHFTDTGDYVLVNKNCNITEIKIPEIYNSTSKQQILFSDHKPVLATIEI